MACDDASHLTEPNTYRKCSEYSILQQHKATLDLFDPPPPGTPAQVDTTYIMTHKGKSVTLTDAQAARLDTDPTGVCREVM
jgi:hypothetical protein